MTNKYMNQTNTLTSAPLPVMIAPDLPPDSTSVDFWKEIKSALTITAKAFTREGQRAKSKSLCMAGRMFEAAATAMRW
jgi:hypothetical protein